MGGAASRGGVAGSASDGAGCEAWGAGSGSFGAALAGVSGTAGACSTGGAGGGGGATAGGAVGAFAAFSVKEGAMTGGDCFAVSETASGGAGAGRRLERTKTPKKINPRIAKMICGMAWHPGPEKGLATLWCEIE